MNVWATWCGPCRQEQPDLVKVANAYRAKGVEFLGIDYQDDQAAAKAWIDQFNVPYPSLFDPAGRTAAQLKYPYLPDTYVVDRSGVIRYAIFGRTTQQELSGLIDEVLASPTASPPG